MNCHSCHADFEDYKGLALHIMSTKKGHKKGRVWASRFLAQVNKKEFSPRNPFSEETKQTIRDCVRELSGESEVVKTLCPSCKILSNQRVESEYLTDKEAWRNSKGTLIVNCLGCKNKERVYG